jgi:hypothetical protein
VVPLQVSAEWPEPGLDEPVATELRGEVSLILESLESGKAVTMEIPLLVS